MLSVAIVMQTGLVGSDDLLFSPQPASSVAETPLPSPPAATYQAPKTSSIVGMMPMQPMPDSVMSPDEMLRAYASSRAAIASPPPTAGLTIPSPTANYNSSGMRTLYSPTTPSSATPMIPEISTSSATRKSLAPTEYSKYDDEDAYGGTAQ